MGLALEEAKAAFSKNEVPVGAVLVHSQTGEIMGRSHNAMEISNNPTYHAEMLILHHFSTSHPKASLAECDLYVTLEPCPMCVHAYSLAHIRRIYFGAYDFKSHHSIQKSYVYESRVDAYSPEIYGGFSEAACACLLKKFFNTLRYRKRR